MIQDDDTYGISPADFVAPAICAHCGHALHGATGVHGKTKDEGANGVKKDEGVSRKDEGGTGLLTSSGTPVAASSSPGGWGDLGAVVRRYWPGTLTELARAARLHRASLYRVLGCESKEVPWTMLGRLHATIEREHPADTIPSLREFSEVWRSRKSAA